MFFRPPNTITIRRFHAEHIITMPQIGISDNRAFAHSDPVFIKTIQSIHQLIHFRHLISKSCNTKRKWVLISLKSDTIRESDALFKRSIFFICTDFFIEQHEICNHYRWQTFILSKCFRIKYYKTINTTQINSARFILITGTVVKLITKQAIGRCITLYLFCFGIKAY